VFGPRGVLCVEVNGKGERVMQFRGLVWCAAVALTACPVWAQWESGSDGSDGAFAPGASVEVDLSLAASLCDCDADTQVDDPCRWDCPSPVSSRGVYDAEQFVIVYKYSTINVPAGVTVTFKNHPSNPPVVWLATGNVTLSGTVSVDGKEIVGGPIPTFTQPGPGGYEGAQPGHAGLAAGDAGRARGFGPGSAPDLSSNGYAAHASASPFVNGSVTYGNSNAQPLTGGSGGGSHIFAGYPAGGSGAGAILIASDSSIVLGSTGRIQAKSGSAVDGANGSGGDIRVRSETITTQSGSEINAQGQGYRGWVRIEAFTLTNNATISGSFSATSTPSVVFVTSPPQLRIVAMCGEFAPLEPIAGIMSTEVEFTNGSPCTIDIEAEGIPAGTTVGVRVIPARGPIVTATSTPLADVGGGLRTATATLTYPPGRSETQLRANW